MTRRVLIVDPNARTGRKLASALTGAGLVTAVATSGAEAAGIAPDFVPNAVVVDLSTPDLDPSGLLEALLRDEDTRVVATSRRHLAAEAAAKLAGFEACIAKPVRVHELLELLEA
jgi:CheY-like chemotaxis protein